MADQQLVRQSELFGFMLNEFREAIRLDTDQTSRLSNLESLKRFLNLKKMIR